MNNDNLKHLKQATAAVLIKENGKLTTKATAWYAAHPNILLTTAHQFTQNKPSIQENEKVSVRFPGDADPILAEVIMIRHFPEKGIDFAVLKLDHHLENRQPLKIMLAGSASGTYQMCGYGTRLGALNQSNAEGSFLGNLNLKNSIENVLFQLRTSEGDTQGFSGAAVFSNSLEAVVAIQSKAVLGQQAVVAMPLFRIADFWKEIKNLAVLPGTCFVIAPKERLQKLANEIVRPIIAEKLGYDVKVSEPEQIAGDDLVQIEQAELIVADVTDNNPHVIYELAVGHGTGTPDIILGEETENDSYNKLPFKVTLIKLDDVDSAKDKLRSKIEAIEKTITKLESTPTNLITNSLRAPLTQISPAYGLALGYFYNFIKQVGDALLDAADNTLIKIIVDDQEITGDQRKHILFSVVIPKHLEWGDHLFINRNVKKMIVNASVSLPNRGRPFPFYALKDKQDGYIQLLDIFPTAMGVIAKAIDYRLNTIPSQHSITAWRELEDKEINRFSSSLINLIQSEPGLSRVIKVNSWKSIFPSLSELI